MESFIDCRGFGLYSSHTSWGDDRGRKTDSRLDRHEERPEQEKGTTQEKGSHRKMVDEKGEAISNYGNLPHGLIKELRRMESAYVMWIILGAQLSWS